MSEFPTMFVVTVEGDHSDADYTGVTKRITSTGAEYRIVGPLADALRRHDDNLDSAFERAYGEALNIRAEVPFEFLNAPAGEVDMETYEAVRAMAQEITRLRAENAEKETMLLNQAKTIKEMQASHEARDALAWMQMHMPYRYYEAVRAMPDEITRLWAENTSLREALKPFADMCADIERCAAEYPADHPASNPKNWFTGSFEWPDLLRARALYEGEK